MIGPSFADELRAKEQATGLKLLVEGLSWGAPASGGGLDPLPAGLIPAQIQAITEVAAAHDSTKPSKAQLDESMRAKGRTDLREHLTKLEAREINPDLKTLWALLTQRLL